MRVGDLVKYASHHDKLQHLVGVVVVVQAVRSGNRVKALWSDPTRNWIWDWAEELRIVK